MLCYYKNESKKMKNLNIFYFDNDLGSFDEFNPRFVMEQLCNELWHIFFGLFNKYLINEKIVASPQQFFKQGKYLKCIYLSKCWQYSPS